MENFRTRFRLAHDAEVVDPVPHDLMNEKYAPPTIREQIQEAIRDTMSEQARHNGFETFEEANDFEEEDPEADPLTIYEMALMADENEETLDGSETEAPESDSKPSDEATPASDTPPAPDPDDVPTEVP